MSEHERFFIVSGGPGSGKTTLLQALQQQQGVLHTQEAGRAIIQKQMASAGRALPWGDRTLFAETMLHYEMASYRWAIPAEGYCSV